MLAIMIEIWLNNGLRQSISLKFGFLSYRYKMTLHHGRGFYF
ncbi:hypothetical protein PENSTE_c022G09592 [Penicillium steckii]|uniref:Uncharacterized protein n=1 Tax=Penicillium steckii TaxID=303698 RepID=A0A1V6ST66_9EURO|nr:hypothetical protein PENSTE_c022G09592 [Penicillium steckii]